MASSPLLDLAPELRNMIYEFCVVERAPLDLATGRRENGVPAICRVNRQLRDEVLPMWCRQNTFTVHLNGEASEVTEVKSWLERIYADHPDGAREQIASITIRRDRSWTRAPRGLQWEEVKLSMLRLIDGKRGTEVSIVEPPWAPSLMKEKRVMLFQVKLLAAGIQMGGDPSNGLRQIVERMNSRLR
ncbi:hypothetical protein Tdes44962_MAKER01757 [Teratosphaeria destructans]|uniref:F-box domain-containing protein n=1 Tax=Teratosphaeria destructans TaxID=418781 RepID=A0A9W7W5D2_9PEZI|nr:hypothetical protein Tdes44962_MAKER01757 [Teratosphaeria destructans]